MIVTLPIKTINESNGSHGHWSTKARRRKQQRCVTKLRLSVEELPRCPHAAVPLVVTLTRIAPSSGLDDDNLRGSLKSVRDGVADALGVDDRSPLVMWAYAQRRGSAKDLTLAKGYGVTIEITARP